MEWSRKVMNLASKRENVIHVFLVGSFMAMSIRSMSQQNDIQALEAQKESLEKKNKAIKKSIWDWKQQLFAEVTDGASPLSLSTLKTIYGETPNPQSVGETVTSDSPSPTPKFVV
eukprot:TRINITY_DN20549_c0_g1_i1.p1 TRINITY_DN20549_c0_g1~~TRINITY_DN20549_c0_g1_i1.p1  ORF type:complete len:115 (-),score=25.55 TRINITY_DN20549_c0_g1_i1:153-497(-)